MSAPAGPATAAPAPDGAAPEAAPPAASSSLTTLGAAAAEPPPAPATASPAVQGRPPAPAPPPPPPVPTAGTHRATFEVPELDGTAPELRPELDAAAGQAGARVDAFVADRQASLAAVAAQRPAVDESLASAEAAALAAVDQALGARREEVQASVAAALARVNGDTAATRAQVDAAHLAAMGAIQGRSAETSAALRAEADTALAQVDTAAAAQLQRLGGLYADASTAVTTAATTAGALAVETAAGRAATYRAGRINEDDGWLDGPLTDNRCEAQAEAAEKVGASYRDELRKEGEKQVAALTARRPTDEAAVTAVAAESRAGIEAAYGQAIGVLTEVTSESLRNAALAHATVLGHLAAASAAAEAGLRTHQSASLTGLTALADGQKEAVHRAATNAAAGFAAAVSAAVSGVDNGLALLADSLTGAGVPDVAVLDATLSDAGQQMDANLAALQADLQVRAAQARDGIATAGAQACTLLGESAGAAADGASEVGAGTSASVQLLGTEASAGLERLVAGHVEAASSLGTAFTASSRAAVGGAQSAYEKLNTNFAEGARQNAENVRQALTAVVTQDLGGVITSEAAKAYDQVQPRWKKIVKWVIIIAIVLVVAVVIGPMVIGAVTGAAAAMGAGAAAGAVGMIVGGAVVGAATSAATTLVDNAISGRKLTTGLGTAIAIGALGGALGGAAASFLAGPIQGLSTVASRIGAQVGIDVVTDTVTNVIAAGVTGDWSNFTWDTFAAGMAMSVLANGVTAHPRVTAVQHQFSSIGFGHGYDTARGVRQSGAPPAISIDSVHVNVGDTQAGGPYKTGSPNSQPNSWNMGGGGHNANAIRGRAGREGYGNTNVATDPVTGVAIDRFNRPKLDNAGNFEPDPTAPGGIAIKETNKSLFPPSMGEPEIQAAAQVALRDAMAGGPNTTHTPPGFHPNGQPKNGTFSAIVRTPEGHPILVEGYYAPNPAGGWEVKTIYPRSDPAAGTIPAVPGSRISVPGGVVTPPDYDAGD